MKLQPAAGQNRRETLQKQSTRSGPGMLNNWPNKLASFDVGQRPGLMLLRDTSMRWMLQEMDGRNAEFFTITTEIAIEKCIMISDDDQTE
ncbi:hypothetical protein T03_6932 [Trichinella britovi]|uniref:Uncharacterized protein n=1 Tax=Trichinella britovi TaxID=45882 RepID=A0A0V1CTP1_TRIBR|nr:hypothetical protein T03_6932 [Trichinella britovi]